MVCQLWLLIKRNGIEQMEIMENCLEFGYEKALYVP